jgi:integrase/recombinase XerD
MNTHIELVLDTRRKKKDNTFPIVLRITHFRKTTSISTGYSARKNDWDSRRKEINKTYKETSSVIRLNNILLKQKVAAQDIINKLHDIGQLKYMSLNQLKLKVENKTNYDSFFNYGYKVIEDLKKTKQIGTARSYKYLLKILKVFTKNKDVRFHEINVDFIKDFERFHLSKKGNTLNGLASYLRTLKAIYNKGIKEGYVEKEAYPFQYYRIKTTPTKKRALDVKYIVKIMNLKLCPDSCLYKYRNYFLISYMLYGISFIDLAFLKIENIVDGRIKFQRKKTGRQYDIKITEKLKTLLEPYLLNKEKEDYIFSIVKREDIQLQYKDVEWERKRYNKGLKKIAALCGIEQNLTSYVSRHSFATQAMLQEVPLQAISAMLGHTQLSTTQIYLKSLPNNILDEYNRKVSAFLSDAAY